MNNSYEISDKHQNLTHTCSVGSPPFQHPKVQHKKGSKKPFLESHRETPPQKNSKRKLLRLQWCLKATPFFQRKGAGTNREHQQAKRVEAPGLG